MANENLSGVPPIVTLSGLNVGGPNGFSGGAQQPQTGGLSGSGKFTPGQTGGLDLLQLQLLLAAQGAPGAGGPNLASLLTGLGQTGLGAGSFGQQQGGLVAGNMAGDVSPAQPSGTTAGQTSGAGVDPASIIAKLFGLGQTAVGLASPLQGSGDPNAPGGSLNPITQNTSPDVIAALGQQNASDLYGGAAGGYTPYAQQTLEKFGLSPEEANQILTEQRNALLYGSPDLPGFNPGLSANTTQQGLAGPGGGGGGISGLGGVAGGLQGLQGLLSLIQGAQGNRPGQIAGGGLQAAQGASQVSGALGGPTLQSILGSGADYIPLVGSFLSGLFGPNPGNPATADAAAQQAEIAAATSVASSLLMSNPVTAVAAPVMGVAMAINQALNPKTNYGINKLAGTFGEPAVTGLEQLAESIPTNTNFGALPTSSLESLIGSLGGRLENYYNPIGAGTGTNTSATAVNRYLSGLQDTNPAAYAQQATDVSNAKSDLLQSIAALQGRGVDPSNLLAPQQSGIANMFNSDLIPANQPDASQFAAWQSGGPLSDLGYLATYGGQGEKLGAANYYGGPTWQMLYNLYGMNTPNVLAQYGLSAPQMSPDLEASLHSLLYPTPSQGSQYSAFQSSATDPNSGQYSQDAAIAANEQLNAYLAATGGNVNV